MADARGVGNGRPWNGTPRELGAPATLSRGGSDHGRPSESTRAGSYERWLLTMESIDAIVDDIIATIALGIDIDRWQNEGGSCR